MPDAIGSYERAAENRYQAGLEAEEARDNLIAEHVHDPATGGLPMLTRAIISERSALTGRVHTWERYGYHPTTCDAVLAHARPGRTVSVCKIDTLPAHIDPSLSQRATVHALEAPQEMEFLKGVAMDLAAVAAIAALLLSIPGVGAFGEALAKAVL